MPTATKTRRNGKKSDEKPANVRSERRAESAPKTPRPKGRSIWKGAISFGMVTIPVAMYPATRSLDISFNLIHSVCNSRIQQKRWCPVCDREVPMDELVRGYQYAKNQYVIMTAEDFQKIERPSSHTLDLMAFFPEDEIDPVYYEKSYYLEPEPMGKKAFALLLRILEDEKKVGLAMIGMRERERLCAVRPHEGTLIVETLFYPDEIRVEQAEDVRDVDVSPEEMEMARMLIDLRAEPFDPAKYHDTYREALMEAIEAKMHGEPITAAPAAKPEKMLDLVSALKASLEKAGGQKTPSKAASNGRKRKVAA